MLIRVTYCAILVLVLTVSISHGYGDNSKFLGNDLTDEERQLGKRRRPGNQGSSPCNFGGGYRKPKNEGSGRTFFDFQYFNVEHNNHLNINCGGQPGYGGNYPIHPAPVTEVHPVAGDHGGHKPLGGFGGGAHRPPHKPHKPGKPGGGGGGPFGNGGGLFGGFFGGGNNKPHKPFQEGPFKPGEGGGHPNPGNLPPGQYLVISNPHLGSYTHSLSAFNPTNLYNKWQQGVEAVLDEFGSYF